MGKTFACPGAYLLPSEDVVLFFFIPRPGARRRLTGALDQLFDTLLRTRELALEELRQRHALFEARDRRLESELAVLELVDDRLEPRERLLERVRLAVRVDRCRHRT